MYPQNNHQKGLRGSLPHVLSPGAILLDFFGRVAINFVDGINCLKKKK